MSARYFDASYLWKLGWPERGSSEVSECAAGASEIVTALHGRAEYFFDRPTQNPEGRSNAGASPGNSCIISADCCDGSVRLLPLSEAVFERIEKVCESASAHFFRAPVMPCTSPAQPRTASAKRIRMAGTSSLPPRSSACAA